MKDFKEIAERCLNGEISGLFIRRNGTTFPSSKLKKWPKSQASCYPDYPHILENTSCTSGLKNIFCTSGGNFSPFDIVDFIPDDKYLKELNYALGILEKEGKQSIFIVDNHKLEYDKTIKYRLVKKEDNLLVFENLSDGSIVYKTLYQASKLKYLDTPIVMKKDKRNVELTFEKAKEWYEKGGELKEVALQAFKEEELKDSKPRSWKEYCKQQKKQNNIGFYIGPNSEIKETHWKICGNCEMWKNALPSKELAEAFLAMMQLMSLRQAWIGEWKPDWNKVGSNKYCICYHLNKFELSINDVVQRALSFPTREMATDFMNCFKDLLEQAKILL